MIRSSVLSALLAWLVAGAVGAQLVPIGGEFQVNTYTTAYQSEPSLVSLSNGELVVVWSSDGQDGSGRGVFGQRYASNGGQLGTEFQVNTYTTGTQGLGYASVDAAADAADGFVVIWTSVQDGSGAGVFGQRFGSGGAALGTEFQVNTSTTGNQGYGLSVASDANRNFVVVWKDSGGADGSGYGVFGQRFDSSGAQQGSEFQVNAYTTGRQGRDAPAVAADASGNFVVVWASYGQDGSDDGIFAQRYRSDGATLGTELQVNTYTTGEQTWPSVGMAPDGAFVVVWASSADQDGSDFGGFGQRFDSTGAAAGSEFQINGYTTGAQFTYHRNVAVAANGDFVVAWSEGGGADGYSYGVFTQLFSGSGARVGTELQVNSYTTSFQFLPAVAAQPNGAFVVVWTSFTQDGDGAGVFGQRIAALTPTTMDTSTPTSTPTPTATDVSTATPTLHAGCPAMPVAGCRTPGASAIRLFDMADDRKDAFGWVWAEGAATTLAELGDPVHGTSSYRLCVYDENAGVRSLVLGALAPAGGLCQDGTPCWRVNGTHTTTGYRYIDRNHTSDGLGRIVLKAGGNGQARISIRARGSNLRMPPPAGATLIRQDTHLIVQLLKSDGGACWESSYSAAARMNTRRVFTDRLP